MLRSANGGAMCDRATGRAGCAHCNNRPFGGSAWNARRFSTSMSGRQSDGETRHISCLSALCSEIKNHTRSQPDTLFIVRVTDGKNDVCEKLPPARPQPQDRATCGWGGRKYRGSGGRLTNHGAARHGRNTSRIATFWRRAPRDNKRVSETAAGHMRAARSMCVVCFAESRRLSPDDSPPFSPRWRGSRPAVRAWSGAALQSLAPLLGGLAPLAWGGPESALLRAVSFASPETRAFAEGGRRRVWGRERDLIRVARGAVMALGTRFYTFRTPKFFFFSCFSHSTAHTASA